MDTQLMEKNWAEIKAKIKSKWSKLNDSDVDGLKADLNQLAGKIESVYGIARNHADRQFDEFKKSVQSLISSEAATELPGGAPTIMPVSALPKPTLVLAVKEVKVN